jgi:hypothetical protein
MKLSQLNQVLENHPKTFPRFVLPDGSQIPLHMHVTEVGHVVRNFVDCGGLIGKEENIVLQTHVGSDVEHRLGSHGLARILRLGTRVLLANDLDVSVEYDCCVVSQYPISDVKIEGDNLHLILSTNRTQCRERERREMQEVNSCCGASASCC